MPATKVETIIASNTLTFFKHKTHSKTIDIIAGLVTIETMLSRFNRFLPPEEG